MTFPATTKIAFMDPDRVLASTAEGRRLGAMLQAFRQKKLTELTEKNRQLRKALNRASVDRSEKVHAFRRLGTFASKAPPAG